MSVSAKTVTHAQANEGAEAFEHYMQTGEMDFEEAFTAAVEASLGVEVEPTNDEETPEVTTSIQTLAFTDQDDCYPTDEEDTSNNFCAAALNRPRTKE